MSEVCGRLLSGVSLSRLNRAVVELLSSAVTHGTCPAADPGDLEGWLLFAIASQSYRSPSRCREHAGDESGILAFLDEVRYLRSELNANAFGLPYARDAVVIRAVSAGSFAELAARYITLSPAKRTQAYEPCAEIRERVVADIARTGCMAIIDISSAQAGDVLAQCEECVRAKVGGGLYLRVAGAAPAGSVARLSAVLRDADSHMQVLVEEDFTPFGMATSGMRIVTFLHNQRDARRYQLLQDAASMGYRITLGDVIQAYSDAGRLASILNTTRVAADRCHPDSPRGSRMLTDAERAEYDEDRSLVAEVLARSVRSLDEVRTCTPLDERIRRRVAAEASALQGELAAPAPPRTHGEASSRLRAAYARLRVVLQYVARLADRYPKESRARLESRVASAEGCSVVAARSGMAAIRTVICMLADSVDRVVSGDHYWETAFLVENVFSHNPHYPGLEALSKSRVTFVPADASRNEIEAHVDDVIAANPSCHGGQLICLDKSISPFFYTRSFDLECFTARLGSHADGLIHPVYLVVDNTLDLGLGSAELFPEGVPRNVFLIFTASNAKLHQLGFDCVTGGIIEIHCHAEQRPEADALRRAFAAALDAEGNLQDSYGLRVLLLTYYCRDTPASFPAYRRLMIDKRRRNTAAVVGRMTRSLEGDGVASGDGSWRAARVIELDATERGGEPHRVAMTIHHDPASCLHGYICLKESPRAHYVTARLFEEFKRRVFGLASDVGIPLVDGTSWGFQATRLDWYLHTLRIAVGVESEATVALIGGIVSSVLKELLRYPRDFLGGVEVVSLARALAGGRLDEIMVLDALIPHVTPTAPAEYLEPPPTTWEYSFVAVKQGRVVSMLVAHAGEGARGRDIRIAKAATDPTCRGQGLFRRMLEHVKDRADAAGYERLYLHTSASPSNIHVVRSYERCGFESRRMTASVLKDGWPLIKTVMEYDLRGPRSSHVFQPVAAETYRMIHAGAGLEESLESMPYPVDVVSE